jgi:hypothetical protein
MKILKNTREKIGNCFLKKELQSTDRTITFKGFQEAASVGILFNATNPEDFELVKRYVKYLRDSKKKVKAIGFFDLKALPEFTYSRIEYDFFSNKELNWYLIPKDDSIINFIQQEFDILIDLNLQDNFPLHYLSALSKAKFKIGKFTDVLNLFDLMIEVSPDKGVKYFLRNLDHYLLQINSAKEKTTSK